MPRLMTWNIQAFGLKKVKREYLLTALAEAILAQDPDVFCLIEMRNVPALQALSQRLNALCCGGKPCPHYQRFHTSPAAKLETKYLISNFAERYGVILKDASKTTAWGLASLDSDKKSFVSDTSVELQPLTASSSVQGGKEANIFPLFVPPYKSDARWPSGRPPGLIKLGWGDETLFFLPTHLRPNYWQAADQLAYLTKLDALEDSKSKVVIAGDFNMDFARYAAPSQIEGSDGRCFANAKSHLESVGAVPAITQGASSLSGTLLDTYLCKGLPNAKGKAIAPQDVVQHFPKDSGTRAEVLTLLKPEKVEEDLRAASKLKDPAKRDLAVQSALERRMRERKLIDAFFDQVGTPLDAKDPSIPVMFSLLSDHFPIVLDL